MYDIKFVFCNTVMVSAKWTVPPRTGEFVEFSGCRFVITSITYQLTNESTLVIAELGET